jgi:hypothetical protein
VDDGVGCEVFGAAEGANEDVLSGKLALISPCLLSPCVLYCGGWMANLHG